MERGQKRRLSGIVMLGKWESGEIKVHADDALE